MISLSICVLGIFATAFQSVTNLIVHSFGKPVSAIGLLVSVWAAGGLFSLLISGELSSAIGNRKMLLISLAVCIAGAICAAIFPVYEMILAAIFLMGMGFSPSEAMMSAVLTDENPNYETRWMNISQIMYCVGAIVAPLAAVWYCAVFGGSWRHIFILCAAVFALLFLYYYTAHYGAEDANNKKPKNEHVFYMLKDKRFFAVCRDDIFVYRI